MLTQRNCYRSNKIISPHDAALEIMDGLPVYNEKTGMLVIPDRVEYDCEETDAERAERYNGFGIKDNAGGFLINLMYCWIGPEKADVIKRAEGSLEEYALGHIPAPASMAENSMDSSSIKTFMDIEDFFTDMFNEEPDGWIYG